MHCPSQRRVNSRLPIACWQALMRRTRRSTRAWMEETERRIDVCERGEMKAVKIEDGLQKYR